jgi:hypothetical protein
VRIALFRRVIRAPLSAGTRLHAHAADAATAEVEQEQVTVHGIRPGRDGRHSCANGVHLLRRHVDAMPATAPLLEHDLLAASCAGRLGEMHVPGRCKRLSLHQYTAAFVGGGSVCTAREQVGTGAHDHAAVDIPRQRPSRIKTGQLVAQAAHSENAMANDGQWIEETRMPDVQVCSQCWNGDRKMMRSFLPVSPPVHQFRVVTAQLACRLPRRE